MAGLSGNGTGGGNVVLNAGGSVTVAAGTLGLAGGNASVIPIPGNRANGGNGGNVTINAGGGVSLQGGGLNLAGGSGAGPSGTGGAAGTLRLAGGSLTMNSATSPFTGKFAWDAGSLHLTDSAPVALAAGFLHMSQTSVTLGAGDSLVCDARWR